MKALKTIMVMAICSLVGFSLQAQDEKDGGLYVRLNVGYAGEFDPAVQGAELNPGMAENIYGSGGAGLYFGGGLGYMFNKHFGIDLGVYYFKGSSKLTEVRYEGLPLGVEGGGGEFTILNADIYQRITSRSNQIRITPALVVKGGGEKINPYARVGFVIPVGGTTFSEIDGSLTTTEIPTEFFGVAIPGFEDGGVSLVGTVDAEAESSGSFSYGLDAAFGVDYNISDRISIFGEFNFTALTIKSNETNITKYDGVYELAGSPLTLDDLADGINTAIDIYNAIPLVDDFSEFNYDALGLYENISEVPAYEAQIIYMDMLDENSNNEFYNSSYDENMPMEDLARRENYSALGFNLGVKINF